MMRQVSCITFFVARPEAVAEAKTKRTFKEKAENVAERLGKGFRGIVFLPSGKDTATFRKHITDLACERGFAVFVAEAGNDDSVVVQRALKASNGIFVDADDPTHPVRGYAEYNQLRMTEF